MIHTAQKGQRGFDRQRRDEINRLINTHGFARRRFYDSLSVAASDTESKAYAERLRSLFKALGPVFSSFGLYLSSRPDLLWLSDCVTLAAISNHSGSTPPASVRKTIGEVVNQTDGTGGPRFVSFDAEPFESRLLYQLHHGALENGDLVVVKVVHPTIKLDRDLRHLPLLAHVVEPRLIDSSRFHDVIQAFHLAIREQVDCRRTAESLETLAHDTREYESLCIPKVYHELCSKNVLVTERLDGCRLDRYLTSRHDRAARIDVRHCVQHAIVPDELARLLCDTWLRQAFQGAMLPVDVRPENILIRTPTEIALLDGSFVSFPTASKRNLLDYLIAAATEEPSKALTCLLKELDGTHRKISQSSLDRQFRQLVAFRDGGWEDDGPANCLSDTLFAQWRLANRNGFQPLRHQTQFYRGTFHIASVARQVAPQRDSLLEGVKDLRLTKLLNDIGTMMEPSYWGGQVDRLASLMILGPQQLDDALTTMAADDAKNHQPHYRRQSVNRWKLVAVGISGLCGVLALRSRVTELLSPSWTEAISAIIFVITGAILLKCLAAGDPV